MARNPQDTPDDGKTAVITIRHLSAWDECRHGAAFLRPIVDGTRRRLAAAGGKQYQQPNGPDAR
jgi:hypothetical protein